MSVQTYLSTDWIEVHTLDTNYMAKVFLTADDEAYMILTQDEMKFFKVDSKLLRLGEIEFFAKVMEDAKELSIEEALRMGLVSDKDITMSRKEQ